MAESIFSKIAAGLPTAIAKNDVMGAREWFRQTAQKVRAVDVDKLFAQSTKSMLTDINITSIGSMFSFYYDPKTKDKLPYYDVFPLIFVVQVYGDGFLGINLHYLPPYSRAKLMDALYGIALVTKVKETKKEDIALKQKTSITAEDKMKLQISYSILKSASKFRLFKPCLKRYLYSHVQSKYFFIEPDKWDMALMLPTQKFVKAGTDRVWRDSGAM